MSNCIRIAICGVGHVAESQLQALARLPEWQIVGAADTRSERRRLLPEDVPFYRSLEALIAECDADIYLVSTPNETHYPIAMQVLSAGKNLLLEKPCCATEEQLERLVDKSTRHNVHLSVLLHAAHARDVEWFVDHEAELNLGPISSFECFFSDPYLIEGKLVDAAKSLGGAWFDSGINALSVVGRFLDPADLDIEHFTCDRSHTLDFLITRAHAFYQFGPPGARGAGKIVTTWEAGVNQKRTILRYAKSNTAVILDHSAQRIEITRHGVARELVSCANENTRLVNHYISVFNDARWRFIHSRPNFSAAVPVHRVLFSSIASELT